MMNSYDAIIIGAGPAGSTLARELFISRPNLKILLIDGQDESNKKPCGGLLAPDAQEALAKFQLSLPKEILSDPQIFAVETIDLHTRCVRYYQRHYLNMDRYEFDKFLLSLVPKGVKIINGRCTEIKKNENSYFVKLKANGEELIYTSNMVIGADGASSIVRRELFSLPIYRYTSIQEWYKCERDALPLYSCIFDKNTSDSYSWTICKGEYFIFGGAFKSKSCRADFENQKSRLEAFLGYKLGVALKREACLVSSPRKFKDFFLGRDGAYLVGEAGGFISASSFEGISGAIYSAKALALAMSEGRSNKDTLRLYKKRSLKLRIKLFFKIFKMKILCSPFLRMLIMKSNIKSVKRY